MFLCREIDRSMEWEGMHGALCFCVERLIGPATSGQLSVLM